ncbi:DNA binding domain-containing protein, excisionase family [Sinomicrobium oceani]|uniref:DNA binding domain-containing protein, excisionase family n=1 Tax=Sinomicrobium oceani TaxID=1150368 RepID=A0A1K1PY98_9FLAO|nr:helix-turn-helix domain-containing protein [Sinomicrobium oceani]SFW52722.1 DNA binding domain-containing protein, excisionase family [Sinomicrobium oceani]
MDAEKMPEFHRYFIFLLQEILKEIRTIGESDPIFRKYMDTADVARAFKVSKRTVRRMRKNKEIPYVKLGKKYLYPRDLIEKMLREQ